MALKQMREFIDLQRKIASDMQSLAENGVLNTRLSDLSQEKLIEEVVRAHNGLYKVVPIDLTNAQSQPKQFDIKGGVFEVEFVNADGSRNLTGLINVKFNGSQNDPINFGYGDYLVHPFNTFFVSWAAQPGVTVNLLIGYEYNNIFRLERNTNANIASVSTVTLVSRIAAIDRLTQIPSTGIEKSAAGYSGSGSAAITPLYTVTAAKTLYLSKASLQVHGNGSSVFATADLIITNAADVFQYIILAVGTSGAGTDSIADNFLPQYAIPAGFKVKLRKQEQNIDSTDPYARASFEGWEE